MSECTKEQLECVCHHFKTTKISVICSDCGVEIVDLIDGLYKENADLRRQLEVYKWIPVSERTPESGKPVLVAVTEGNERLILRAMYCLPFTAIAADDTEDWAEYDEKTDEYYCHEGWYENNLYEEIHFAIGGTVTHWLPLPNPPEDAK